MDGVEDVCLTTGNQICLLGIATSCRLRVSVWSVTFSNTWANYLHPVLRVWVFDSPSQQADAL
jgi:hypothetical protein